MRLDSAPEQATVLQLSSSGIELVPGGPWDAKDESELVLIAAGATAEEGLARATAALAPWFPSEMSTKWDRARPGSSGYRLLPDRRRGHQRPRTQPP